MRAPSNAPNKARNQQKLKENPKSEKTEPAVDKEVILAKYERCSFCNSKLLFTHDLNLSYLQVVENSRCPGCGVTMRPRKFTLH